MSFPIRATLLTAAVAACAWAADEAPKRSDLRVMIDALPAYEVSEEVAGSTSDWRGDIPNQVVQLGIEKLWLGERSDGGGAVYGLRVNGSSQSIQPTGFSDSGTYVAATNSDELRWRRLGLGVVGGWQSGAMAIDSIRLFGELTAFAEVAAVYATRNSTLGTDSSLGYGLEGGLRAAVLMAEADWYGGIAVTAVAGLAKASLVVNGDESGTVTLSRSGVGIGVIIGRRF